MSQLALNPLLVVMTSNANCIASHSNKASDKRLRGHNFPSQVKKKYPIVLLMVNAILLSSIAFH